MSRVRVVQIAVVAGFVLLLEALCLAGVIDKITMQPPHRIVVDFVRLLASGRLTPEIAKSMGNVLLAFALAYVIGIVVGTVLHGFKTARDTLDPLFATYYAIPVFAFLPPDRIHRQGAASGATCGGHPRPGPATGTVGWDRSSTAKVATSR